MHDNGFITGYSDLSFRSPGPFFAACGVVPQLMVAHFNLEGDISALLPYINAVAEGATLYEQPIFIKFSLNGFLCCLHPTEGSAGVFEHRHQARQFLEGLIDFINELHQGKDMIRPNPRVQRYAPVLEVFKLLPGRNCRDCGYLSCMAFAAALSRQEAHPVQCPGLGPPLRQNVILPVYGAQGNLDRTVSIDVDAGRALKKKQARIADLENELARLTRIDNPAVSSANGSLPVPLTHREIQVLSLMARGASNIEISNLLKISHHTVKSHVIQIFNKLGVDDRTEASVWAARNSLV